MHVKVNAISLVGIENKYQNYQYYTNIGTIIYNIKICR